MFFGSQDKAGSFQLAAGDTWVEQYKGDQRRCLTDIRQKASVQTYEREQHLLPIFPDASWL
jgi:hypothetical protein